MEIFHNGVNHGNWSEEDLPRLAKLTGVSVDELIASSKAVAAKSELAENIKTQVKTRLGTQEKINSVTANVAVMALIGFTAMLDALSVMDPEIKSHVDGKLSNVFGDTEEGETSARLLAQLGRYVSGDLKTPIHAYGVDKSMGMAEYCAQEAFSILASAVQNKDADPVTG